MISIYLSCFHYLGSILWFNSKCVYEFKAIGSFMGNLLLGSVDNISSSLPPTWTTYHLQGLFVWLQSKTLFYLIFHPHLRGFVSVIAGHTDKSKTTTWMEPNSWYSFGAFEIFLHEELWRIRHWAWNYRLCTEECNYVGDFQNIFCWLLTFE